MNQSNAHVPYALAMVAGAILWAVGSAVSDRSEAWDSGSYWTIFYPAAIVFAVFSAICFRSGRGARASRSSRRNS